MLTSGKGTIYPDGKIRWDGVEDQGQRVVAISKKFIVEHMPSGGYWNNGGFNKTKAWLEVLPVKSITPGNAPGTYRVELDEGPRISWHPTQKVAREDALSWLEENIEN